MAPAVRARRTHLLDRDHRAGRRSDAAGIRTSAARHGDGYVLNGGKHFISDGLYSDFFIVSAVTDPVAKPRDASLFLVDKDLPGVTIGRDQEMMGLTGTSHVELFSRT